MKNRKEAQMPKVIIHVEGGLKGVKRTEDGRPQRTTTRPVKAIDRNIRLNQALWYLTEKMAELKGMETCPTDWEGENLPEAA